VLLSTGDIVPADLRLIHSNDLKVNDMILTRESEDVLKKAETVLLSTTTSDKLTAINMVFASTAVATGHAIGVVVETGMQTRVGAIAALLKHSKVDANGKPKNCLTRFFEQYQPKMTPLQQSLHKLGVIMGTIVLLVCVMVFMVGMIRGDGDPKHPERPLWLYMVMVAVSLAGLPQSVGASSSPIL
jgi:magnesium-transporting ATPase (P-type)